MKSFVKRSFGVLSSYGLSCVLFVLLLVLTYLGTLEQVEHGLYETREKYFQSLFFIHSFFGRVPLPLPGAYLLLLLLAVNLALCAFVRTRMAWRRAGILMAHAGILVLLAGALISLMCSENGYLTLYEQESSSQFESYRYWEIGVRPVAEPGATVEEAVISSTSDFLYGNEKSSVVFVFPRFPLRLTLTDVAQNARPQPARASSADPGKIIDGYVLVPWRSNLDEGGDVPGAYVTLENTESGEKREGILWGGARSPLVMALGDKSWAIDLRRKRWELPFAVTLNKFTRELHPRTNIPKVFESDVTVNKKGLEQRIKIGMNEPLRRQGYTLFQSSWGPPNAGPNDRLYSTLAVSRNPAEQFPLLASLIISLGFAVHFCQALLAYLRTRNRRAS